MSLTLDTLDIHDTSLYVSRGYPWDAWDLLRDEAPVYWYEREGIAPFWAITRHADVLAISRNAQTFINGGARLRLSPDEERRRLAPAFTASRDARGWDRNEPADMVFMDDPRHRQFRLLTNRAFTPGKLRRLVPRIDELARGFADDFEVALARDCAERGQCDFVRQYACRLPLATIGEMMGLPPGDWMQILKWTNAMLGDVDTSLYGANEPSEAGIARAVDMMRSYFDTVVAERLRDGVAARASEDDSASDGEQTLIDRLINARIDGQPLTDQQLHGYLLLLTGAGNETTRNATAGGLIALLDNPDQRDLLCAQPELLDSAVEEILRYSSPVVQFARTATRDVDMHGTTIRAGDTVGIFYPSANRDERTFPDPYRFDITRNPNPHIAFGHGAHFCLGANLARVELRAALTAIMPLLPRLELVDRGQRVPHLHVPGYHCLNVRLAA